MQEILEEHCRFLRGKRVTSDDIREGLVELVRGDKYRRLALRRVLKAFGKTVRIFQSAFILTFLQQNRHLSNV